MAATTGWSELAMTIDTRMVLGAIRLYQSIISPGRVPCCRFTPSCSEFTYQAVEKYGVMRGIQLGVGRLLRCHPFNPGGYDPVP